MEPRLFQQIGNLPLAELVVDALREMILTGQIRPGEHLKESDIAAALNVSRGPVREAFTQLASEGHVELRRHRGAFVNSLSSADIDEVYTLRLAIEQLAAERACLRMAPQYLDAMEAVLAEMKSMTGEIDPRDAVRLDLKFHDLIYAASEHQRVERVWFSIRSHVALFLHTRNVYYPDFATIGYREHLELRDAIGIGDPAIARQAVLDHVNGAYEKLKALNLPERISDPP